MSSFRDDVPPWSFFIPITLAVIVGVLAADAIRFAIGTVFDGGEMAIQAGAGAAAPVEPAPAASPGPEPVTGDVAGTENAAALPEGQGAAAAEEASRSDGVLELPDSMSARRDGEPAACVNGTVANRVAGGWEQALEGDAPIPCVTINR